MQITIIPMVEGYEQVVRCHDPHSGLRALISIHNTTLGPALGGMRMWPYRVERDALLDVNRLAKSMTYKAAAADAPFGGGKAVIIGDPQWGKSEALLRAMGRFIDALAGRYITAEDVGTTVEDMVLVRRETPYVAGLPRQMGSSGDPARFTALGVLLGIRTCVERRLHTKTLQGVRVAIQGCGNVARQLCQHLARAGAELIVTDVVLAKAQWVMQEYGARLVAPEAIYDVPCEVYAPCALGGTLNDDTIPRLQCQIVAGSANNQCLRAEHSDTLRQRGIVYAPDFVINAGGLLNIASEYDPAGYDAKRVKTKVHNITNVLCDILDTAEREGISTHCAAMRRAERRLARRRLTTTRQEVWV